MLSAAPLSEPTPPNMFTPRVIAFCLLQLVVLGGVAVLASWRYEVLTAPRIPPVPRTEPIRIGPLYDEPAVVSEEQLRRVLQILEPRFRGRHPKINHVDHALRFWGMEAVFDDPRSLSGQEMRDLLLDHRAFRDAWGEETDPFLVPDTTGPDAGVSFRTREGTATASHVDHTLAGLAEVGTPLDYPVITPAGETTLAAALQQSLREFSLNQVEYEWSTLAYLHYMPHAERFHTTEGQEITWDRLAGRLMRQRLSQGVCFGNHRLHALALLLRADEEFEMLTPAGRRRVIEHLKDATARLVATQHAEGWWDVTWPGDEPDGPAVARTGPSGELADRMLATGHALEWWAFAPAECQPPRETLVQAGQWLVKSLDELTPSQVSRFYPFLSHVGRALCLWRGRWPAEWLAEFRATESA